MKDNTDLMIRVAEREVAAIKGHIALHEKRLDKWQQALDDLRARKASS